MFGLVFDVQIVINHRLSFVIVLRFLAARNRIDFKRGEAMGKAQKRFLYFSYFHDKCGQVWNISFSISRSGIFRILMPIGLRSILVINFRVGQ